MDGGNMNITKEFIPTEEQKRILNIKEGLHLVLAPPGSGKTELLAQRVYNAKNDGYQDSDIICLTFTNRAAKGMNERIDEKYPNNEIIIGNIHHFCSTFLFKNKIIPLNTSILDEEEADQLIEEFKKEFNYPPKKTKIYNPELIKLATYEKQKKLGFSESILIVPKYDEIPDLSNAKRVCEAYNGEKAKNNYLDFDDLLTLTYYYLKHDNKQRFIYSQFKWVQVDEVQDLNPLQWAIIEEISAPNSLIVYFGDYEQAIFSFMGAKLDSLHKIESICKNNPKNGVHNLVKNFRSPSYLLDIYVKYAETHWTPTWKKRPVPNIQENAPENSLRLFEINGTIEHEAGYIVSSIIPNLIQNDDRTAILVRFNNSADTISNMLKIKQIPHFKISGFDLFRRKSVKGLMAFFSIYNNEYDRISWARIFYEFGVIETLKNSRAFIHELNSKGITPIDILKYNGTFSRLNNFFDVFENGEMVIFDTETTGLDTENDDIIQIAGIKILNGIIIDTFEIYINTDKDISESEKTHHISKEQLSQYGVSHEKGLTDFIEFIGNDALLVAHNIGYDFNILKHNLQRYCGKSLTDYCKKQYDSITIAKLIYPNFASYKLKDLLEFLQVEGINSHNALDDVKATFNLIKKLNSDFNTNLKSAQKEFISNLENRLIFNKFITRFKELYSVIKDHLEKHISLNQVTKYYFDYYKSRFAPKDEKKRELWIIRWEHEMYEIDKLLKHFNFYTNKKESLTLHQKIDKYIPEYRKFKESDLYLGTEKIVVSTVYKAKGLEFENVIVAEATDDIYPMLWVLNGLTPQQKEESILEDARTFYVAMTRSKKRLYITSHTRSPFGHPKKQSEFIKCISGYFE
ncbi:MAG TPA: 3'-5' exonuclease [Bacteroidales bacterium]|nr:3'-5' exonuclease [Bacteroidales bacterium]